MREVDVVTRTGKQSAAAGRRGGRTDGQTGALCVCGVAVRDPHAAWGSWDGWAKQIDRAASKARGQVPRSHRFKEAGALARSHHLAAAGLARCNCKW